MAAGQDAGSDATATIVDYVLSASAGTLPAHVRQEGLRSFFNILACTIGGARHDAVETTWRALSPFAGAPQVTLIGRGVKTDAITAGLINTLSSSALTFDDTHAEAIVHPSGPVMAAVLAVAEQQTVSGRDLLAAFTLGVEMVCRLSKAISVAPAKSNIGWSQTGVACGVGAALAAGKLLGLDAQGMRRAVGIAASQASGIRAMHGTMCTPFMPAQAGQTGLRAAYLAGAGLTSSETSIEHRYGYAACFAEITDFAALTGRLGAHFEILANTYKPFPCGIVINPLIDAALQVRSANALASSSIARVALDVSPGAIALCDRRHPKDELEGQVSLYQWVAAALVRGKAGVPEGTLAAINDAEIKAFREIITATAKTDVAIDACRMRVHLKDGRMIEKALVDCIGSRGRPMTNAELEAKLAALAAPTMTAARSTEIARLCWRLEELPDAMELIRAVA